MNVFRQSSNALTGAINRTSGATRGLNNLGFGASTIAGANMGQYMNPYINTVVNRTTADMNRGRQMALNDVGAEATAAGAFGGSRHGLVEAETNRGFADAIGDMSAGLRQQGYNTALGAAQFDAGQQQTADMANANLGMQKQQFRLSAANQLGALSNLGFGMGQQIQGMQGAAGAAQRGISQSLIDAAKGQYAGYAGAPYQGLNAMIGATSGAPVASSTTTSSNPGLLGFLSGGASILGSLGSAGLLCWVARAAFGEGDEWLRFRKWMLLKSPDWLFRAYVKHGPKLADWIERNPVSKPFFRAAMRRAMG